MNQEKWNYNLHKFQTNHHHLCPHHSILLDFPTISLLIIIKTIFFPLYVLSLSLLQHTNTKSHAATELLFWKKKCLSTCDISLVAARLSTASKPIIINIVCLYRAACLYGSVFINCPKSEFNLIFSLLFFSSIYRLSTGCMISKLKQKINIECCRRVIDFLWRAHNKCWETQRVFSFEHFS